MQYGRLIRNHGAWVPRPVVASEDPTITSIQLRQDLPVRDMRDWIHRTVGHDYDIYAVFIDHTHIPNFLRFGFVDMETALLFKLAWI